MNTAVELKPNIGAVMEDVIIKGDLSKLTPEQRVVYYQKVCDSIGLNSLTQPLMYITFQNKLVLYCKRDGADQLRKLHGINIEIANYNVDNGLLTVHARAKDKTGRIDEDYGVVSVAGLRGEIAANAFLKAVTKAKRRVTLSISGLGFLDGTEVDDPDEELEPFDKSTIKPLQSFQAPADKPLPQMKAKPAASAVSAPKPAARTEEEWRTWATAFIALVRAETDADGINELTNANAKLLAELKAFNAEHHQSLVDMIDHRIAQLSEDGT
jgi:hypothetical protein